MFIFNPSIIYQVNLVYVLSPLALILLIANPSNSLKYISNKRVFLFLIICLLYFLYLFLNYLLRSQDSLTRANSFLIVRLNIFCALLIFNLYNKVYFGNKDDVLSFILKISAVQVFFVMTSVLIPEFREWTLQSAREESTYIIANDLGSGLRSYGLASGYNSTFPMFMGICSLFSRLLAKVPVH